MVYPYKYPKDLTSTDSTSRIKREFLTSPPVTRPHIIHESLRHDLRTIEPSDSGSLTDTVGGTTSGSWVVS